MLQHISVFMPRSLRLQKGASAVEYGLIIGLIAVAILAVITLLGGGLEGLFTLACNAIPGATCT